MNRLLCVASLLAVVACRDTDRTTPASSTPQQDPPGAAAGASIARVTTPAPAADVARVVAGTNDLGLELYRSIAAHGRDAVLSPSSIAVALSMAYAGAAGETEAAYHRTLRFGLTAAAHHRAMNDLDRQLTGRSDGDPTLPIAPRAARGLIRPGRVRGSPRPGDARERRRGGEMMRGRVPCSWVVRFTFGELRS